MFQQYDFAKGKVVDPGMRQAIVLVENKAEADRLATLLRESFYPVKGVATDVHAGLELVRKFKKGVLFLDADVSGADMDELLEKIGRRYPNIKTVMVMASVTKERIAELQANGAVGFLLIPFESEAISKLLARIQ